jgi:large subunit ribosomal protein L7A
VALDRIRDARKRTIGSKQTVKAVEKSIAKIVYIARDADEHIARPLENQCRDKGIEVVWVDSMTALGKACGIEVGAATAAVTED